MDPSHDIRIIYEEGKVLSNKEIIFIYKRYINMELEIIGESLCSEHRHICYCRNDPQHKLPTTFINIEVSLYDVLEKMGREITTYRNFCGEHDHPCMLCSKLNTGETTHIIETRTLSYLITNTRFIHPYSIKWVGILRK